MLTGCTQSQPPTTMAPPMNSSPAMTAPMPAAPMTAPVAAGGQNGVYNWTDVPTGRQEPVQRAVFDQGGYQLYTPDGTVVVPFQNQNLYVMKFGQSNNGQTYFVNDGQVPTLFLPPGGYLENAVAQGAKWYPFSQNFNYAQYNQPMYVGPAPSWNQFVGMGWYPGMAYYGGYYGMHPYGMGYGFAPMVGLTFLIGGASYYGWNSYHSYYGSHPGYIRNTIVNQNIYHAASMGGGRTFGGSRSSSFGGGGRTGSFGSSGRGSAFGSRPSGGFGSSTRGFGSSPSSSGSFGRGSSGFGSSAPRSGGSFGGSRPSSFGGSFGGGRSGGFGGSSFGGGGRSFGGGGGRRR